MGLLVSLQHPVTWCLSKHTPNTCDMNERPTQAGVGNLFRLSKSN